MTRRRTLCKSKHLCNRWRWLCWQVASALIPREQSIISGTQLSSCVAVNGPVTSNMFLRLWFISFLPQDEHSFCLLNTLLDDEQLNGQQRWCINQTLFRLRTSLMWPSLSDRLQFQVFLSHVVLKSNTGDYCGFVLWTNTLHWWLIVSGDTFIPLYLMCCENHQCNIRAKSMTVKAALC